MADSKQTAEELLRELQQEAQREQATHSAPEDQGPRERGRAMLQGLTFGGADEAEAYVRSLFTDEDYDTALADVRKRLDEYRGERPWEALGYEAGGATIGSIIPALFTGGSSLAATSGRTFPYLARLAALGSVEGGTYAFLTGEGGAGERAARVPGGMAAGAVGGAVGGAATRGLAGGVRRFVDIARRRLGPRAAKTVEQKITKAVRDGGYDNMQQVIDDIVNGRVLADNKTIASIARAWRATSAEADEILSEGLRGRPDRLRQETMDYLQDTMGAEGNALRRFQMDDAAARTARGADYDRVFAAAGSLDDDATENLLSAIRRVPRAPRELDEIYQAKTGKKPFFRVTDDGIEFDRNPTLEEAEIIRRAVNDRASALYRQGAGGAGEAVSGVERGIRSMVDEISPELRQTRTAWSGLERAREAFDAGKKALSGSPDEAAIAFERATQQGDEAVKAYRAGVVHALRRKASTGSRKSLPKNIVDENTKEGQVLRMVFPEDNLDELLRRTGNAADAQEASNIILGGSPTAITQGRMAEQGLSLTENLMDLFSGDMRAPFRLAGQAVRSMRPDMTPKQAAEAAKLVVETNPNVVARALTDRTGMDALYNLVDQVTRGSATAGTAVGGAQGGLLSAPMLPN